MRQLIVKLGLVWSCILFTTASCCASVLITVSMLVLTSNPLFPIVIVISIVAPAIIAPTITWVMVSLILKVDQLEQEQRQLASYDHLTGQMARRLFTESAEAILKQAKRQQKEFTLAMIDIDRFKVINDSHGHLAGDEVLKSLANILKTHIRTSDLVGRLGGDEFVVALFDASLLDAKKVFKKILNEVVSDLILFHNTTIRYDISVGFTTTAPSEQAELRDLLHHADLDLYVVKKSKKIPPNTHARLTGQ